MIEKDEFERWTKSAHNIFEIFEGRHDAYPLCQKWTRDWLDNGIFRITEEELRRANNSIENFNYDAFRDKKDKDDKEWKEFIDKIKSGISDFMEVFAKTNSNDNIGFGVALYLFT